MVNFHVSAADMDPGAQRGLVGGVAEPERISAPGEGRVLSDHPSVRVSPKEQPRPRRGGWSVSQGLLYGRAAEVVNEHAFCFLPLNSLLTTPPASSDPPSLLGDLASR